MIQKQELIKEKKKIRKRKEKNKQRAEQFYLYLGYTANTNPPFAQTNWKVPRGTTG